MNVRCHPTHLRAYLKRLPDFADVEAEEKALNYARRSRNLLQALSFLVSWPALDRAANLVLQRSDELDGEHYEILTPAADALASKYPLAATLVLRAMIDFTLRNNRSSRYRHAARHLLLAEYLHELAVFPNGKHDDQADSTAQFLDWFKRPFPGQNMYELTE